MDTPPPYEEAFEARLNYRVDALDDKDLSVAAKALWVAILSQHNTPGSVDYLEDLVPEDVFYEPLMELKRKGYLNYED